MKKSKHALSWPPALCGWIALGFLLLLGQLPALAQSSTLTVSGTVQLGAAAGDLSGTTVLQKGSKKAVTTDASGHYDITVPSSATLIFSHVGYAPVEVRVNGRSGISITLALAGNSLDQVVVVSYGKQRQRDITGSVAKVDASAVQDVAATEFGQKLQSKVAGLQATQSSGMPGQAMVFRIRGSASLSSGNQPLIVVDGQPISSDVTGGTGDVQLISPDEIESYSVLKDAAATALYGSRAANGVIIITTKQAKIGRTGVTANAYYGLQSVPQRGRPDLMNAREFATFMQGYYQDRITYENWVNPLTGTATIPSDYANPSQYGKGTDWYSAVLRTAPMENYAVNLSSGNDKVSSSTTFNYFNQQGVLYNTGVNRYAFRSNNEYRPISQVKIGLNLAPTYQIDHNTRGGSLAINGNRQVLSGAEISSPLIAPKRSDGTYNLSTSSYGMYALPNFYQQLVQMNNDMTTLHLLANAYVDVEIVRGLHAKSTINGDLFTQDFNAYYGTQFGTFGAPPPRPNASSTAQNSSNNTYSWLNENTLDYAHSFGDHNLDVLAGYTTQKWNQNFRSINGTGFANDAVPWISGATSTTGSSNNAAWTVASELARVNYDYKKKYYLSGTIRNDGSSRFGANKKYGTFPSISAGWVASDENFFPKTNVVSFLKIKGSYGLAGNFNVGNYTSISQLNPTNYVFNGATTLGESVTVLGNPNLTWEQSKQTDIGLEANFLKNRISFSYDYYNKQTEGMLSTLQLPYASGFASMSYNVGSFRMWGHEFMISTKNLVGAFTWTTDFNISFNNNKVLSLVNNTPIGGVNRYNDYNRTAIGHPIGELYGYVFQGVYMNQADFNKYPHEATSAVGTARMKDVNGDGIVDINDETFIGNPSPKYIFGITNTFAWKNFDLNIIAGGQVGNKIMNTNLQNLQNLDGIFNIDKDMQNRWRSEQDPGNGKVPRTLSGTTELYRLTNTNWVFSGDYLSIRNIALGYTFQQRQLRYIKGVRVYASVQNAFTFTKYPGQNPEVNDTKDSQTTAGTDNGSYPVPRTVMFGANFNF
jgi:TonB-linked SusC/RagA family outer membrane protein